MNNLVTYLNEDELFSFTEFQEVKSGFSPDSIYKIVTHSIPTFNKRYHTYFCIDRKNNVVSFFRRAELEEYNFLNLFRSYKVKKSEISDMLQSRHIIKLVDDHAMFILKVVNYMLTNDYGNYDNYYNDFIKEKVPSELKKVPSGFVYRGLSLSQNVVEKIKSGKKFSLNSRKLTSWTTEKKVAKAFAKSGIILKTKPNSSDIIFNSVGNNKYTKAISELANNISESEVVLKGNGIGSRILTEKDIEEII